MIIRDNHQASGSEGTDTFTLVSVDGSRRLSIRLTDQFSDDFRDHLAAHGFRFPAGDARSVVSEVIVATASSPAAWTAVGGTVVAFLHRHRGKVIRFEAEGKSVSIEGCSAREVNRMATDLLELSRKSDIRTESGPRP